MPVSQGNLSHLIRAYLREMLAALSLIVLCCLQLALSSHHDEGMYACGLSAMIVSLTEGIFVMLAISSEALAHAHTSDVAQNARIASRTAR